VKIGDSRPRRGSATGIICRGVAFVARHDRRSAVGTGRSRCAISLVTCAFRVFDDARVARKGFLNPCLSP
jgi:hypothetical protein